MNHDDSSRDLEHDDPLLAALAELDPTMADAPPGPGSPRHLSILEHAMTTSTPTADQTSADAPVVVPGRTRDDDRHPSRRRRTAAAMVAAAAVIALGVLVLQPSRHPLTPTPSAALSSAARNTSAITSLRATLTHVDVVDGATQPARRANVEISGDAFRFESIPTKDAANPEDTVKVVRTIIGLDEWETFDGETTHRTLEEGGTNLPYQSSSAKVIQAALQASEIRDLGDETVRGEVARHFRITLDEASRAALADLSPRVVAQFELEYPQDVDHLDIWTSDDLIRRIRVVADYTDTTTEFYDFNEPITIRPPS